EMPKTSGREMYLGMGKPVFGIQDLHSDGSYEIAERIAKHFRRLRVRNAILRVIQAYLRIDIRTFIQFDAGSIVYIIHKKTNILYRYTENTNNTT
ncbi:MAG: hypothetical protein ABFD97_14370, partial [Syntrophobacter sp.]